MALLYDLPSFSDPLEFLSLLARKTGKLSKGGTANVHAAARSVLHDWNTYVRKSFIPIESSKSTVCCLQTVALCHCLPVENCYYCQNIYSTVEFHSY